MWIVHQFLMEKGRSDIIYGMSTTSIKLIGFIRKKFNKRFISTQLTRHDIRKWVNLCRRSAGILLSWTATTWQEEFAKIATADELNPRVMIPRGIKSLINEQLYRFISSPLTKYSVQPVIYILMTDVVCIIFIPLMRESWL